MTIVCSITAFKPAMCDAAQGLHGVKRRCTDAKIAVGDRQFYVAKGLLASFSHYFDVFFYGDFEERNKDEFRLEDVDPVDFEAFLNVIVPPQRPINGMQILTVGIVCLRKQSAH